MTNDKIRQILDAFSLNVRVKEWKPFGHGHINDTFLVATDGEAAPDYIVQRKNHLIFKNISGMMNNIFLVTDHIRKQLAAAGETDLDRRVMTYLPAGDGNYFFLDADGNYWTISLYIRDSYGIEEVTNENQAFSAGKAFGYFQQQLADLEGSRLIETIPNFHNGIFRYRQFTDAISQNAAGRLGEMQPVVDRLLQRADEMLRLQKWLDSGELPLRITHNDTKINNILFDRDDRMLCIIDLDTVMPGSILFDFGDAIRTLGNAAAEDEANLSKIQFRADYFEAFAKGYLSESRAFLTPKEVANLAFSCRYMVWEQAIRFLTDYLNGDTYYKIAYRDHNKVRTLSQLRYLEVLEANAVVMEQIVSSRG